jgi:hypothetical protein
LRRRGLAGGRRLVLAGGHGGVNNGCKRIVAHNFQVAIKIRMQDGCRPLQMKTFMLLKSAPDCAKRYVAPQDTVAVE